MLVASPLTGYEKLGAHHGPPRIISEIPKRPEVNQPKETVRPKIAGDLLVICTNERRWWPRRVIIRGGQLLVGSAHCEGASPSLKLPLRHLSLRAGPLPNSLSLIKGTTIVLTIQTASQRTFDLWVKTIAIELIRQTPLDAVKYLDILTLKDCWNRNYDDSTDPKDFNCNNFRDSQEICTECRKNQQNLDGCQATEVDSVDSPNIPKEPIEKHNVKTIIEDSNTQRKRYRNGNIFYVNGCNSLGRQKVKVTYSTGNIRETYQGSEALQSPTNKIVKVSEDFEETQENQRNVIFSSKNKDKNEESTFNRKSTNGSFRKRCEEFQKIIENQKINEDILKKSPNATLCRYKSKEGKCYNCNHDNEEKIYYDFNRNTLKSPVGSEIITNSKDVVHTVEILFKKCQSTESYVPVREKLVLFESLSRLGRVRSTEDVSLKVNVGTKRARSLHDLSNCFVNTAGVREICKYFENKTDDGRKLCLLKNGQFCKDEPQFSHTTITFNRNLHNVSYA